MIDRIAESEDLALAHQARRFDDSLRSQEIEASTWSSAPKTPQLEPSGALGLTGSSENFGILLKSILAISSSFPDVAGGSKRQGGFEDTTNPPDRHFYAGR